MKLTILFSLHLLCVCIYTQNIEIPDSNFKQYLMEKFDTNGDEEINLSEAQAATYIACPDRRIKSLIGI